MTVRAAADRAGDHPVIEKGARLGYAASGVLHLLLAWVTVRLAFGSGGEEADQQGALSQLGSEGAGRVLLVVLLIGFVLLALWQAVDAIAHGSAGERVKAAAKAVVYAVLAVTTIQVLSGSGSSGGSQPTAGLLGSGIGRVLVGLVGLGIVAVGGYHVVKGWKRKFLADLRQHPGRAVERAGQVGYIGKGIALAVLGVLVVTAAVTADPERAEGMDVALRTLAELPFGAVLLCLIALGFAAYGVYAFGRARYAKV